jgi:ABC-type phosphate transport system substrate-binding protein
MKKLIMLAVFAAAVLRLHAQDIAFIAHPAVTEPALSADDAKGILLGTKTTWSAGTIKLIVLQEGAVHEKVIKDFTQRTPDQFDKFWKKQVFTGKGTMPAAAKSDAEVIAFVASTPGAFGYVERSSVTDKVKVLPVK